MQLYMIPGQAESFEVLLPFLSDFEVCSYFLQFLPPKEN